MKLVLCENIRGLGSTGEVVVVKDGYARNYLLPQRKAGYPTEGNVQRLQKARSEYLIKESNQIEAANLIAAKMVDLQLNIEMKANDAGQLFGSVTEAIVAEGLSAAIDCEIRPQMIIIGTHFKKIGEYVAALRLHSEVEVEVMLHVVPEEGGADEDELTIAELADMDVDEEGELSPDEIEAALETAAVEGDAAPDASENEDAEKN